MSVWHLTVLSLQDEMVPPQQMTELHSLCRSCKVSQASFPEASHMNAYDESPVAYWTAIREFIEECSNNKKSQ